MQVTAHIKRIEAVEKDLKALSNTAATKDDLSRMRAEMKKVYDGLDIGMCVLQVWKPLLSCLRCVFRIPKSPAACMGHS